MWSACVGRYAAMDYALTRAPPRNEDPTSSEFLAPRERREDIASLSTTPRTGGACSWRGRARDGRAADRSDAAAEIPFDQRVGRYALFLKDIMKSTSCSTASNGTAL